MARTRSPKTTKFGYDYEFVDPPPKSLECSICLLTLREPHVVSCCGHHFCFSCINRISNNKERCPLCKEPSFTTFLHKGVAREVNALKMYCPNKPLGCEWVGELGQVEKHFNPEDGSRERGCDFVMVECRYRCGAQFQRQRVAEHETEECANRPIEVQMAFLMKQFAAECKAEIQAIKQESKAEIEAAKQAITEESEAKIEAAKKESKAEIEAIKKAHKVEIEAVENNSRAEIDSIERSLQQKSRVIDAEILGLKAENTALKQQIRSCQQVSVPPFYFAVMNYKHYRRADYRVHSPPFYSHPGGYKMRIDIFVNGHGTGKGNLSLYIFLLRGEYDDELRWPFRGRVGVEMYNTRRNEWIMYRWLDYNTAPIQRPEECETNAPPGCTEFLPYDLLMKEYLVSKELVRFRISSVIIQNTYS